MSWGGRGGRGVKSLPQILEVTNTAGKQEMFRRGYISREIV